MITFLTHSKTIGPADAGADTISMVFDPVLAVPPGYVGQPVVIKAFPDQENVFVVGIDNISETGYDVHLSAGAIEGQIISNVYSVEALEDEIPGPEDLAQANGFIYTRDSEGTPKGNVNVIFIMTKTPDGTANSYSQLKKAKASDATGLLVKLLQKGATYTAQRGKGPIVSFIVPSDVDTFQLPNILGTP